MYCVNIYRVARFIITPIDVIDTYLTNLIGIDDDFFLNENVSFSIKFIVSDINIASIPESM